MEGLLKDFTQQSLSGVQVYVVPVPSGYARNAPAEIGQSPLTAVSGRLSSSDFAGRPSACVRCAAHVLALLMALPERCESRANERS